MDLHNCNPLTGDEGDRTISSGERWSLALSHAVTVRCIGGDVNETVITFRSCRGTRSHMRSGFETRQEDLGDLEFGIEVHGARQRSGLRADNYNNGRGNRRYSGVGLGLELPTRMHYFEGALNGNGSAHANAGRGLHRVPAVNFEVFRTGGCSSNGIPLGIFTSEFERHLFDGLPCPRNARTARQTPNDVEHRAAAIPERTPGMSSVCTYDAVTSEQAAVRPQSVPSNDKSPQQRQTSLAISSPGNEAQCIEDATIQRGGPALLEDGLGSTPDEAPHGQGAASEHAPRADCGEASQDDAQSVCSSVSDRTIVFTPGSSVFGSGSDDSANSASDTTDEGDNVHFDDNRGWQYGLRRNSF